MAWQDLNYDNSQAYLEDDFLENLCSTFPGGEDVGQGYGGNNAPLSQTPGGGDPQYDSYTELGGHDWPRSPPPSRTSSMAGLGTGTLTGQASDVSMPLPDFNDLGFWDFDPGLASSSVPLPLPSPPSDANPAKPHACNECQNSFKYQKDLKRHKDSVHATTHGPFRCRCGRRCHRKDNHSRHVRHCGRMRRYPTYLCRCGDECAHKRIHNSHLVACGFGCGKSGRPSAS